MISLKQSVNVIDIFNIIDRNDNITIVDKTNKSLISNNNNNFSTINIESSRGDNKLNPVELFKRKQTAAKKKRYKTKSFMNNNEELVNQMKVVNSNRKSV